MFSHAKKPNSNFISDYYKYNLSGLEKDLKNKKGDYWQNLGAKKALATFHKAATSVPAYKAFLKKHKVDPAKIKTITDFGFLPSTNKENYIASYPLQARAWDGDLSNSKLIASSSGTTGHPNYWPRSGEQEQEAAITHELLFRQHYSIHKYKTLAIVGFPMGVYVSGMATTLPLYMLAQKYPLTVLSAGNNKAEVLKAVKNLGKNFDQILLIGHPFFIKDVLETGTQEGIKWKDSRVSMMFCSEGFNETWREYLLKEAGLNGNAAFNTYGSSELLLMAYETPLSVKLRKLLEKNKDLSQNVLGEVEAPNLFQYNPALRFIQEEKGEFLFTAQSGIPLIRFNLHDSGKIIPYQSLTQAVKHEPSQNDWQLPFLSLKGRSDYTVIFYAANIYPQHIHAALSHKNFLHKITGKFSMVKGYRKNMDEYLEINIELRAKVRILSAFKKQIAIVVFSRLKEINSEFADANSRFGNKTIPIIKLWRYQHEKYFKPGLKPKYIQ